MMSRIAIIGAGAWGTALALVLARRQSHVIRLWANEPDVCESVRRSRINERFLPGFTLPSSISVSNELSDTLDGAEMVVSVMPSQHCRSLFTRMTPYLRPETLFISCTK